MTKPAAPVRRLAALLSLTAAMVLTGANVVLGKAIVTEVPVCLFMFYRFVVSTARVVAAGVSGSGAQAPANAARAGSRSHWHGAVGHERLHGLDAGGFAAHLAGRCRIITATLPAVAGLLGLSSCASG